MSDFSKYRKDSLFDDELNYDNQDNLPESDVYQEPWRALGSWFLGPRGENKDMVKRLITDCLDWYVDCRGSYFPTDPSYITDDVKASSAYQGEMKDLETKLEIMHKELSASTPFFSNRYQGHMIWETTIPSTLGYFAGMLWNQNNVDSTTSPVTSLYEVTVGKHLCELMNFDDAKVKPWAHLTCGGSIANIEAMWAARNMQMYPLAVREALKEDNEFKDGLYYKLSIPTHREDVMLKDCTTWELLNLPIDTVCSLSLNILKSINKSESGHLDRFNEIVKKHTVQHLGLHEFLTRHNFKMPAICASGTHHYSWPKGATVLGMGTNAVINIGVDLYTRQSMKELREALDRCVASQTPVMMAVAVIGSTEESAVDPLEEMVSIREAYYTTKGLNFAIHADAAWGGYMLSMLKKPDIDIEKKRKEGGEDFVPFMGLSDYVIRQYKAMKYADTVTIDPHKTGFCQYPAGALAYRNGSMRHFVSLKSPAVFHGDEEFGIGVYGLEGSKPGAAAAGVLLSHRVIGLDQFGYGRILGQCQYGAVLFYCLWLTVAEEYDEFVCENMVNLPPVSEEFPYNKKQVKEFIRKNIVGKSNEELAASKETKKFLKFIGPDALINTFVVNMKGESNSEMCNKLNNLIVNETSGKVGQRPKRIELFLTTCIFDHQQYGEALCNLKQRLGLKSDDGKNLVFLRNTNMNPFQASNQFIVDTGRIFRNIVKNCIGALTDPEDLFTFIAVNKLCEDDRKLYLEMLPCFGKKQHQYHVIIMVKLHTHDSNTIREMQIKNPSETIFFQTTTNMTLMKLLRGSPKCEFNVSVGKRTDQDSALKVTAGIREVLRYQHIENIEASAYRSYPKHQQYFLYGNDKNAYMSHAFTKYPDFQQIIDLDGLPSGIPLQLLDLGIIVTIAELQGSPHTEDDKIVDPLNKNSYEIEFIGWHGKDSKSVVRLAKSKSAKIWFDSREINDV